MNICRNLIKPISKQMTMVEKYICVFCSSSDAISSNYENETREFAKLLVNNGFGLVYGGSNVGLMGIIATEVKENGGKVIGIIPERINDHLGISRGKVDELIITKDMGERKKKMEELSDGFVALPGGFGTLEEITEAIVLKQLKYHNKPVVFLNINGFYKILEEVFGFYYLEKFAKESSKDLYYFAETPISAISYLKQYTPANIENKWF